MAEVKIKAAEDSDVRREAKVIADLEAEDKHDVDVASADPV